MNTITINVDGLDEGIRCALCTNPVRNERGCDGSCSYNKNLLKNIMGVIQNSIVENTPTVEARAKGEWLYRFRDSENSVYFCSNCRAEFVADERLDFNFCPNCGADMGGTKDDK